MKKIQVLMSTYNGAVYLREQLDSILKQDCEEHGIAELAVLIRDDGSRDGTQKILEEYHKNNPDKICWIQGENCGVIESFFTLLKEADHSADYYAFSDQDDYWMPDKVRVAICELERLEGSGMPGLYCCRPRLTDANLQELPGGIKRPPVQPSFGNALIENVVTGCTMVINPSLRELVIPELPGFTSMHDRWLYLVASCFGEVIYDETPHILYRQHGGNVVGTKSNRFAEFWERIGRFRGRRHDISRQTEEFLRVFGDLSKENLRKFQFESRAVQNLQLAEKLVAARHSFLKRASLVRSGCLYRQRNNDNKVFKVLILLGIY